MQFCLLILEITVKLLGLFVFHLPGWILFFHCVRVNYLVLIPTRFCEIRYKIG